MKYNIVVAVTTYNRQSRLEKLISSFAEFQNGSYHWHLIIADDGSTDGTLAYLEALKIEGTLITIIKNNRQGVHHQFNTIVQELEQLDFDYCFKCDDDIEFIKPGWEQIYIDAIQQSGYDHLCHFDPQWRQNKNLKKPIKKEHLLSLCNGIDVQGAFFTLTPQVIAKVGYMDTANFGFRGVGHVDYTLRACRAGFNAIDNPFDVINSNDYICHQKGEYTSAMNKHVQHALESDEETQRKYAIAQSQGRVFVEFNGNAASLNKEMEHQLLLNRLETLEKEKAWYELNYGHQPVWFIQLGKLLRIIMNVFSPRRNKY